MTWTIKEFRIDTSRYSGVAEIIVHGGESDADVKFCYVLSPEERRELRDWVLKRFNSSVALLGELQCDTTSAN